MKKQHEISIIKASGEVVPFYSENLKRSLLKAGASEAQADNIILQVEEKLYNGISTKKIYRQAFQLLKNFSKPVAAKYKLRRAIMELGPSGFPFEKYVAEICKRKGYAVQTGKIVQGNCVKHEVDVIAEKENRYLMIECKFHNQPGIACDVKIPLYINSRFKDLEAKWKTLPEHHDKLHEAWVVTNTRFTADAAQYGICCGMNLLGWDYPANDSLNKQIDALSLYLVTALTSLSKNEKQNLLNEQVILCKQITGDKQLLRNASVSEARINLVMNEATQLCTA
jgi:hypothetical protein